MYKAVGFNLGGVIILYAIPSQLEAIAQQLDVPAQQLKQIYHNLRPQLDIDSISFDQFWRLLVERSGSSANYLDTVYIWSDNYVVDNPILAGMIELVDRLKEAGYKVGLLSNIDSVHGKINADRGIFEHFDVALLSYLIKTRKPQRESYEALWQAMGVSPEEMIFIDDLDLNVKAAEELGLTGIKFDNYEQLIGQLRILKIEC